MPKNSSLQVWEIDTYKGHLGFKPQNLKNDPLLQGKNRRSLRILPSIDLRGREIRKGEFWLVEITGSEIQQKKSKDGRAVIKMSGCLCAKQMSVSYISRITNELVQKFFSDDGKTVFEYRTPVRQNENPFDNTQERLIEALESA